ncbi:hypothetical protein BSL82_09375 [Tardibacter chloracetimidivorans]|uniref:Uncharacterized protein n=1 Tax=Tardibacter chloracetimidivorans TaxID=1921510 RepID=A0A1L3ZV66_9SPHN|nr:hypothetical protein BSL82_09375 [Tardibacter chloracetimidivorans]
MGTCETCRWWNKPENEIPPFVPERRSFFFGLIKYTTDEPPYYEYRRLMGSAGSCRRNPETLRKWKDDWCGEYIASQSGDAA